MSILDGDFTKKYLVDGTNSQTQSSAEPIKTCSASTPITIFSKENAQENAKKLGLSQEQYLEIINNPEFLTLSPEEQINYINNYKSTALTPKVVIAKETTTTTEPETQVLTETNTVTDDIAQENQKAKKNTELFDGRAFCELSHEEQVKVYTEEYAKNHFLFNGEKNENTIEDWNNLSEEQKEKYLKGAEKRVSRELNADAERKEGIKSSLNIKENKTENSHREDVTLEQKMLSLQAANLNKMSSREFDQLSLEDQNKFIGEYLSKVQTEAPDKLSHTDEAALTLYTTTFNAVKEALDAKGIKEEVPFGSVSQTARKNGVSIGEATLQYLEKKEKNTPSEMNEVETAMLSQLRKVPAKYLETFASKAPSENHLEQELLSGHKGRTPRTNAAKNSIVAKEAYEKYKDQPEKLVELLEESIATGNIPLSGEIIAKAKLNPAFQKMLANSQGDVQTVVSGNMEGLDEEGTKTFTKNIEQITKTNPKKAEALSIASINSTPDENLHITVGNLAGISDNTGISASDRINDVKDIKTQLECVQTAAPILTDGARVHATVNSYKLQAANQAEGAKLYMSDSVEATEALNNSGNLRLFAEEAQTAVFQNIQNNIEELFPEKQAIEALQTLTNQIPDCAVSNQLDMHKSIMGSKYEEIQTYAASNVYKYDKSVQADAIKVVYNSGNTKAIDAANMQLSKCDAQAVQSISKEVAVQLKAMEARHSQQVANFIGDKAVSMAAAKDPAASSKWSSDIRQEKIAQYAEKFKNGTPLEKFRMISSLQGVWQEEVIAQIASTCPELLSSLISSMGADLFQLQLTPDVKNKIMLEMIRIPDMQADALKYFKDNPSSFSADIKSTCAQMLIDRDDEAIESQIIKNSLPADKKFITEPDELYSGGKISNREYYASGNMKSLWRRDKDGYYIS